MERPTMTHAVPERTPQNRPLGAFGRAPEAGPETRETHEPEAFSGPAILSAQELSLWYGTHQALHGISLDIQPQRITAIIGPSGCGKSTLLRCFNRMNDLFPPIRYQGVIDIDGENVIGSGVDLVSLRRKVGMVFQRANPFPMSIFNNVAYGPRLLGVRAKARLEEVIESALRRAALWNEVKDRLNRSAMGLSGGQQQRLCIARALAVEPEVLLLDEPASALDPTATARIEELILELKETVT